jgi:leucyl aminopeptidase
MSKWVSGQQLLDDFGIRDIELFNDYVQKGLQPHNDLGQPISPSDVVEEIANIARLKEQYEKLRHTVAEVGNEELQKFDASTGYDLLAQIGHYEKWVLSVKKLDWNEFKLPEMEAEAMAVLTTLVNSLYHIEDIKKFFNESKIEKKEIIPEPPKAKKLRPDQEAKLKVQQVAKELYDKHPEIDTVKEMVDRPEIMETDGKHYRPGTRHKWISEVAPKRAKDPGIRPEKKKK